MHDYHLTPAEIASLQEQLRRDSAELDTIFDSATIEKQMLVEAKEFVINSKSYVTAKEIADIAHSCDSHIGFQLRKWECEKLIFVINYAGVDYFPLYALDPATKVETLQCNG